MDLFSQIFPNNAGMSLAFQPACGLFVVVVASTLGLLAPG